MNDTTGAVSSLLSKMQFPAAPGGELGSHPGKVQHMLGTFLADHLNHPVWIGRSEFLNINMAVAY